MTDAVCAVCKATPANEVCRVCHRSLCEDHAFMTAEGVRCPSHVV